MILGFAEDGVLAVYADLAHVQRQCEGVDVESGVYVFYAEDGTWLRPRFVEPNRRGGFWFLRTVASGRYVLEPEVDPPPEVDAFDVAFADAVALDPNPWFADLESVRAHVEARRLPPP